MLFFLILLGIFFFVIYSMYSNYIACFFKHPILTIKNAYKDIKLYVTHKEYNRLKKVGYCDLFTAYSNQTFGCGKTLTMVKTALSLYYKYDGKPVWSEEKQDFVIQHVNLISNIKLNGVRYYRFIDEHQFTDFDKFGFDPEDVNIFMIDEIQALYDSRNFKDNISPDFMTTFLQCRKNNVIILGTAQRFSRCDKFLREMTSTVITCTKTWRYIYLRYFNAQTVEHMEDVTMLVPDVKTSWFATDQAYLSYDTKELVEKLKRTNYISSEEIINNRDSSGNDFDMMRFKNKIKARKKKKGVA